VTLSALNRPFFSTFIFFRFGILGSISGQFEGYQSQKTGRVILTIRAVIYPMQQEQQSGRLAMPFQTSLLDLMNTPETMWPIKNVTGAAQIK